MNAGGCGAKNTIVVAPKGDPPAVLAVRLGWDTPEPPRSDIVGVATTLVEVIVIHNITCVEMFVDFVGLLNGMKTRSTRINIVSNWSCVNF